MCTRAKPAYFELQNLRPGTLLIFYQVKEGDVVTVRGKGRVEIGDITVTKKGRYKINMCRTT